MSYIWDTVEDELSGGHSIDSFQMNPRLEKEESTDLAAGGSSYVWDASEEQVKLSENEGSRFSSRRVGQLDVSVGGTHSNSTATSSASSSFGAVVGELKTKVDGLRSHLDSKTKTAKSLNAELTRLHVATERKTEKLEATWQQRRKDLQSEHDENLKSVNVKIDALDGEMKQLAKKTEALRERCQQLPRLEEEAVGKANLECKRKLQRAERQWEAEEKLSFEKVLATKVEALKKQAADSFAPRLENLVTEGKLEIRRKSDDFDLALIQLKRDLQLQFEAKLAEARDRIDVQLRADRDKACRAADVRLEEARRLLIEEGDAIRRKHAKRSSDLEAEIDRLRRVESESSRDAIRELRKSQMQAETDLCARQELILSAEMQRLQVALTSHRRLLEEQLEANRVAAEERKKSQLVEAEKMRRDAFRAKIAAETERVLSRLSEEVKLERSRLDQSLARELEQCREARQRQLAGLEDNLKRAKDNESSLRAIVEKLKSRSSHLSDAKRLEEAELSRDKELIITLRESLHEAEHLVEKTEAERLQLMNSHREALEREVHRCEEELRLDADIAVAVEEKRRKLDSAVATKREEIDRVRGKVSLLLRKKDEAIDSCKCLLRDKQRAASELEELLFSLRNEQFGDSAT